jgi:hypothetical protein
VPCRGINEVQDDIGFVSSMDYDLGYFDLDTRVLEPLDNPLGPRLLPMSQVRSVPMRSGRTGLDRIKMVGAKRFEPSTSWS